MTAVPQARGTSCMTMSRGVATGMLRVAQRRPQLHVFPIGCSVEMGLQQPRSHQHHHRLDDELANIGEECSLSDYYTNIGRGKAAARATHVSSALVVTALRTAQILREGQVASGQRCRDPPAPYRRWRDDGGGSGVGLRRHHGMAAAMTRHGIAAAMAYRPRKPTVTSFFSIRS